MGPALLRRVQRALAGFDRGLERLRAQLTPGQRWTSGLLVVVALLLLLFGQPTPEVTTPTGATEAADPAPRDERPAVVAPRPPERSPQRLAEVPAALDQAVPERGGGDDADERGGAASATGAPADTSSGGVDGDIDLGPAVPPVVALVREEDDAVPGRDDRTMAEAYLAEATFHADLVVYDPAAEEHAEACREAAPARLVLAGFELPEGLRRCLREGGTAVLAYDDAGSAPPTDGAGRLLSTRRGVGDVLIDLARWGTGDPLDGRVGLVAAAGYRSRVEDAREHVEAAGIELAAVHYVEDDDDVADGVLTFDGAAVEVTVLAIPVAQQRRWVTLAATLRPTAQVRYVVADAADAVLDEDYPPVFDGARAYTPLAVPWQEREDGEHELRTSCRQRWEDTAGPSLSTGELARALAWCQHVRLVERTVVAVRDGEPVGEVLPGLELDSPLTTPVGPLDDGGWGPRVDHALRWRATCSCWTDPQETTRRDP